MRVLHVDSGRKMRGGQWQALWLARGMGELGHRCAVLAPPRSPLLEWAREAGLDAWELSLRNLLLGARAADLVHAHDARSHSLTVLFTRKPLVVSRRVAFGVGEGFASRWKYKRASHFIAVSEFVRKKLLEAGVEEARVSVVYDGVPLLAPTADAGAVISPRFSDPSKGSDIVAEAARLAGVGVHFSDDLVRDLARASLFLYSTRSEGLGSAALLAMSAAVPVIASREGGLPEIVVQGVTGLLVENRASDFAEAVQLLMSNPALRRAFGLAGRERVAERFTVERMVRGTLEVYRRVLECGS